MTRRKDGLWQEVLSIDGKKKYFYGKTKAAVLRKVQKYKEVEERGKLFSEVAEKWWEQHEPTLSPTTCRSYRPALQRAVEAFGDTPIKDLTPPDINKFLLSFTNFARKTVSTQLMVVNLICKYAVTLGYITYNPAREIVVPKGLKKEKRSTPSPEDIERIKNSFNCTFGMFAYFALYTGCRRGELLALTWEDIDLKSKTITINKSVYHTGSQPALKSTKTEAGNRIIPLLDKLAEKLQPSKGLIFGHDGKYLTNSECRTLWNHYCAESGVTCTLHQLRHAYATMLFENNIDPKDAQSLLGHAQLSTTMDIYTDIRTERQKQVWDSLLSVDIV